MTKEEIERGKVLIAEFEGFIISDEPLTKQKRFLGRRCLDDLSYDEDWNMLMPVVERIESMGYLVYIFGADVKIIENTPLARNAKTIAQSHVGSQAATKRLAVFSAIVDCVEWLNKNKEAKI